MDNGEKITGYSKTVLNKIDGTQITYIEELVKFNGKVTKARHEIHVNTMKHSGSVERPIRYDRIEYRKLSRWSRFVTWIYKIIN
jgi:hypothetical protein